MGGDEAKGPGEGAVEDRVQGLATELATLINEATPDTRKDLRELAVGLVRESVVEVEAAAPGSDPASSSTAPFNPLGIGIPLLLVGLALVVLFPPVGLLILLFAVVMLVWGFLSALRLR